MSTRGLPRAVLDSFSPKKATSIGRIPSRRAASRYTLGAMDAGRAPKPLRTVPETDTALRRRARTRAGRPAGRPALGWPTGTGRPANNPAAGGLNAGGGLFKPVEMCPNQVEDAAAEFNSRVQIVSPPPDQLSTLTNRRR